MIRYKTFTSVPRFQYLRQLSKGGITLPLIIGLVMLSLLLMSAPGKAADVGDPLETVNRGTLHLNRFIDTLLLKPIARGYAVVVPEFAKRGVHNFFSNLGDVNVVLNDVMQLKLHQAGSDLGRIAINSSLGVGGLFNVAGNTFGLEKHDEDFGQTLASWGVGAGPYVMLPIFGPSTLRDSLGLVADIAVDPVAGLPHEPTRSVLTQTRVVNYRAEVLPFDDLIVGDEYLYIRGAWLQHRDYQINDGREELAFEAF